MSTLQEISPVEHGTGLQRNLKKRHLLMMSLGGTIGTGLFIGIAEPLYSVGPLGTLLAYLFAGGIMLATMMCLGELSCAFPHSGSFQHYALLFLPHPLWSYTIGWLYWLSWVFSLAADLTAAGFIAHHFFPDVPVYLFCLLILLALTAVNLCSARSFGECEYWLSAIKVFAIVLFIAVGGVMIFTLMGKTGWQPTLKTETGWFPHGGWQILVCMTIVIYSFQGAELVGNAAGETEAPHKVLPKVIKGIGVRIILFYGLAVGVLALVYPWQIRPDGSSPFVWVLKNAGIPGAQLLMTLVIFSAAISAANSAIYASSRMLWSMAGDGFAPKRFGNVNQNGVPVAAILATGLLALVSLLTRYIPAQQFYLYLIASTGQVGCLAWITIGWCQYRFRRAVARGDYSASLIRYRSPLFPWLAWLVIVSNIAIIFGTWFSEQGVIIMLVELLLMLIVVASWFFCHPAKGEG
ncbi:amino acid/polyamine/organocation transporter (APC superfamily) [Yokenella regensburgei]|uniref:Amino acid/polyamine/organocation transporter (APC superfamily) n=1 Tax=Yokenella regensburgei TaxID=158877 RepID=A0ABX9RYV0_9ENTR|nr:amino acid permease [Yokenella regensburgei]RKR63605.1 amino acid/polyamine/organocation transporter (APC superfamily) [Yokenella regensburgei]VFS21897.1 Lysine-specific permease [Yokenella regensburgei]